MSIFIPCPGLCYSSCIFVCHLCQLPIFISLPQIHSWLLIGKNGVRPLKYFSFHSGMMLSFVSRGRWRDFTGTSRFSFWFCSAFCMWVTSPRLSLPILAGQQHLHSFSPPQESLSWRFVLEWLFWNTSPFPIPRETFSVSFSGTVPQGLLAPLSHGHSPPMGCRTLLGRGKRRLFLGPLSVP